MQKLCSGSPLVRTAASWVLLNDFSGYHTVSWAFLSFLLSLLLAQPCRQKRLVS